MLQDLGLRDRTWWTPETSFLPRRARAPLCRDDPGRGAPHHALCAVLPLGRGPDGAVLHLPPAVPGRDAGDRPVGQHPAPAGVLGADLALVLPAHRLLEAPARRPAGRADGACRDRGGRARADRGDADPRRDRGQLQPDGDPARGRGDQGLGMVSARADPDPARRLHEIGAVPVPLLAAACDGGADAGLGLSAFGHDGEGGRVPDGALWPVLAGTTPGSTSWPPRASSRWCSAPRSRSSRTT
jgi:hypothetical protein